LFLQGAAWKGQGWCPETEAVCSFRDSESGRKLQEVPQVSVEVFKDGDGAVGLFARFANKGNVFGAQGAVVAPEIVGMEKEEDAAARLPADELFLLGGGGAGEKQAGFFGAGGSDEHPALAFDGGVLDEGKAEDIAIPGDGLVAVADDKG
jgi:hypothetical protein